MQLSGPPRLTGTLRGYASADGPIEDQWEDRSTYVRTRRRLRLKGPRQLWPSWTYRFVGSGADWLATRSDLRGDADGEIDWTPRTRAAGDPEWLEEHTYRARVVGGLPTLSDLQRKYGDGQHAYVVDLEIEGVEPYQVEPDAVVGGYLRLNASTAEGDGYHDIAGYGDATVTETSYTVQTTDPRTGETVTGTRYYADLGDDRTAATRTSDEGDGTITIHTRDL